MFFSKGNTTIILTVLIAVVFGCSGTQVTQEPQTARIDLMITSPTDVEVEIEANAIDCNPLNSEDDCKLSALAYIVRDTLYFDLYSSMAVSDTVRMKGDLLKVEKYTNIRNAEVWINSGGGSAFTGLAMADEILAAKERGWTIRTKATGIVASAAVPVFAVGEPREAAPGTIFMVHEPAMFKWPGMESASAIRAQNDLMVLLQERYMKYLLYGSNIDLGTWQEMERRTTWFTAEKAETFGLVTTMTKTGVE